jgi:Domain of unknown function (DUF4856)
MINRLTISCIATLIIIFGSSCKKDNNSSPVNTTYAIPTTYTFANVNYNNQLMILAMADQVVAQINLANTAPNTAVSAQTLIAMFNNTGEPFNDSALALNTSGLKLAGYFSAAQTADILNYFDSIGVYSQSTTAASPGIAGVSPSSVTPAKKYLLSPNGIFYSQVVKKAIMGMCAHQIANIYMADSVASTTDTITLEHYWDAAFGLFGVPVNFPAVTTGLRYFGSYSNQVNAGLNSNTAIMNAFLKGRAAIANNDLNTMKAQAATLINAFDSLDAAAIVQEMHETNTNIEAGDAVAAYGTLSESLGFVRNLAYNSSPTRVITSAQIAQLLALHDSTNPDSPNLYNFVGAGAGLTTAQIEAKTNAIAQFIGQIYGFSATELPLL